jgi:hypothetical protein
VVVVVGPGEGEELTCDYTLADYDCVDKGMQVCGCGGARCLGQVLGFKVRQALSLVILFPIPFSPPFP